MHTHRWVLVSASLVATLTSARAQQYSFDSPGSTFTYPLSINPSGTITGYYEDGSRVRHGFVRDAAGNITSFDPTGSIQTISNSINPSGTITGAYTDAGNILRSFVRDAAGNITSFEATGSIMTFALSINPSGTITGYYEDDSRVYHGFIRYPGGHITSFDATVSASTYPASINPSGTITGYYYDGSSVFHGFVRDAAGHITSFDATSSITTAPLGINPSGTITGYYYDGSRVLHGFVRDAAGNVTSFDPTRSTFTFPVSINPSGTITGSYEDASSVVHGFVGTVPNGIDVSRSAGNVSDTAWQSMVTTGVSFAVVQAWDGGGRSPFAADQLVGDGTATHGAQGSGLKTGAFALLNYFSQDSSTYQIDQAIQAVGAGEANLKFLVLDIEICCGEFVNWRPSDSYAPKGMIMDPASHIQKVISGGTSGPVVPTWNDAGGTTTDGSVTWMDTGKIVISQADRVSQITAAAAYVQSTYGIKPVIYTDRSNWTTITGNCDAGISNNCSTLVSLPLWDVEHKTFVAGDGLKHCGDGVARLAPFKPYSPLSWQMRSGNQYDGGLANPAGAATTNEAAVVPPSWDEYEFGVSPKGAICAGDALFGLANVDLDYFNPTLFQ